MMEQSKPLTKEQIRQSHHQQSEHKPPPTVEEIRRQLGWHLCNASAKAYSTG
jgi:hypothetical protein